MFPINADTYVIVKYFLAYLAGGASMFAACVTYIILKDINRYAEGKYELRPHTMHVKNDLDHVAMALNTEGTHDFYRP